MRKDYRRNSKCPVCGEMFNYLGLASHRAACRRKYGIVNHKHWAIFRLMGLEDEKKQKDLIPFINQELKKGYSVTTIFQEIMESDLAS